MDNVLSKGMAEFLPWRSGAIASGLLLRSKAAERSNLCKQQNGSLFRDRDCFVVLLVKKWSSSESKWVCNGLRAPSSAVAQPGNPRWRPAGRTSLDLVLLFGAQVGTGTWWGGL